MGMQDKPRPRGEEENGRRLWRRMRMFPNDRGDWSIGSNPLRVSLAASGKVVNARSPVVRLDTHVLESTTSVLTNWMPPSPVQTLWYSSTTKPGTKRKILLLILYFFSASNEPRQFNYFSALGFNFSTVFVLGVLPFLLQYSKFPL